MGVDVGGNRLDVSRVIVKISHEADARHIAFFHQYLRDFIEGGAGCTRRVLRIQRHHQYIVAVLCFKFVDAGFDARVAITHRGDNRQRAFNHFTQITAQHLRLPHGVNAQWRAFFHPDGLVFFCRFGGANIEDDDMQNQPPDEAGNFDDARIPQKFFEIFAD